MAKWSFITNHAVVLSAIEKEPSITAREIAELVHITERAVRKIIADLDAGGYIRKKKVGRRMRYKVNPKMKLRHPTYQDMPVASLLAVLWWEEE